MPAEGFAELMELLGEAVPTLGYHRVGLGCGISVAVLRAWLLQRAGWVPPQIVIRTLPRLRRWQGWTDGYREELEEARRLRSKSILDLGPVAVEVRHHLDSVRAWLTDEQVSLGCELPWALIDYWRLGGLRDHHRDLLLKAVAHMRYAETWPVPQRLRGRRGS